MKSKFSFVEKNLNQYKTRKILNMIDGNDFLLKESEVKKAPMKDKVE